MKQCPNCGAELSNDHAFCKNCGAPVSKELKGNTTETEILSFEDNMSSVKEESDDLEKYPTLSTPINSNRFTFEEEQETTPSTEPTTPQTESVQLPSLNQTMSEATTSPHLESLNTNKVKIKKVKKLSDKDKLKFKISFVLGIISIILLGMPVLSLLGLVVALFMPRNIKERNKAVILNIVALIIGVISVFVYISVSQDMSDDSLNLDKIYKGNGYTLKYADNWQTATLPPNDINVLKFSSSKSYIAEIDHSSYEDTIKCDFTDESCQNDVYNDFYEYWKGDIAQHLDFEKDIEFKLLKEDVYIAKYTYKMKSTEEVIGKYYLLVCPSKNAVLSFVSKAENIKIKYFDSEVTLLLTSIEIENINTKDNINNWKDYSILRTDVVAKNMNLNGEYRILAEDNSYWVFNDEEFWYFKSEDKRNDNYWYGKYKYKTGKKGLSSLGIAESEISTFVSKTKKDIDLEDVYSLVLTPERIISSGEDKSSEIPENTEWKLVWILVNHKKEGIEAQVLNIDSNEYSYYFKVKD